MKVYRFALYNSSDELNMSTEVDAPDPTIDGDFWNMFMGGACTIEYLGEFEEETVVSPYDWEHLWTVSKEDRTADVYVIGERRDCDYKVVLRDRSYDFDQTDKELSLDECREIAEEFVTGKIL